jgi:transposase
MWTWLSFLELQGFRKEISSCPRVLYHAFGVRGYGHVCTAYRQGRVEFEVCQASDTLRCSACGSDQVIRRGQVIRQFKTLPIGGRPTVIVLPVQRLGCQSCGRVRQVRIAFADTAKSYTRSFERYAAALCRKMTIVDVANHLQVDWDMIKDIHKRYLQHRFRNPKLHKLKRIAIDEISIGKGQRYLTVVLDLQSGAVVFVGQGKGADALNPFFSRLKRTKGGVNRIEAVATDMSPAYTLAVARHLPRAIHVFDRFHVVKLYNEKLSDLRRDIHRSVETIEEKQLLKGTRWLLLKNPQNLDPDRNEQQRLDDALRINQPLATAYYMKEDLRCFWDQSDKNAAEQFLDDWIGRTQASGIAMLKTFAKTLMLHRRGLLGWYDAPISTGPLEGTNNKIKTLQRQAYGFRDQEYFTWRIYGLHEAKYALTG